MRIPLEQLDFLKQQFGRLDLNFEMYLFGSRLDNAKRGGDIDVMVLTEKLLSVEQKLTIKLEFYKKFGEQKLDIVNFTFNAEDNFKKLILLEGEKV
jgi:predicted nucleotidyltransferase